MIEISVIDPISKKDYIIKENKVRILLSECEMGPAFLEAVNQAVINLLIAADNRRKRNRRMRLFECDL